MRLLPGIVAGQRPWGADADEEGFAGLGQVIADNDEKDTAAGKHKADKLIGTGRAIRAAHHHEGDAGSEGGQQDHAACPYGDIGLRAALEIGLEGVEIGRKGKRNAGEKRAGGQDGEDEQRLAARGKAICLTAGAPVNGDVDACGKGAPRPDEGCEHGSNCQPRPYQTGPDHSAASFMSSSSSSPLSRPIIARSAAAASSITLVLAR